ncbi:MAG: 30S ribosomal protein S8 [Patescibacteria group bacterium]
MYSDPISDLLTRIRNASLAKKHDVMVPYSKLKFALAEILRTEGFVERVEKVEDRHGSIRITLQYDGHRPKIMRLERVSKPGRRVYAKKNELPKVLNHYGLAVISTPQGLMTNKQAAKVGVGGEVICEIY